MIFHFKMHFTIAVYVLHIYKYVCVLLFSSSCSVAAFYRVFLLHLGKSSQLITSLKNSETYSVEHLLFFFPDNVQFHFPSALSHINCCCRAAGSTPWTHEFICFTKTDQLNDADLKTTCSHQLNSDDSFVPKSQPTYPLNKTKWLQWVLTVVAGAVCGFGGSTAANSISREVALWSFIHNKRIQSYCTCSYCA